MIWDIRAQFGVAYETLGFRKLKSEMTIDLGIRIGARQTLKASAAQVDDAVVTNDKSEVQVFIESRDNFVDELHDCMKEFNQMVAV